MHSPLDLHVLRKREGCRNRLKLLWLTVLQLRFECVAERGPDECEISVDESVCLLRGQPGEVGGPEWRGGASYGRLKSQFFS